MLTHLDPTARSSSCADAYMSLPDSCNTGEAGGLSLQIYYCDDDTWCCGKFNTPGCCSERGGRFRMLDARPILLTQAAVQPGNSSCPAAPTATASACPATSSGKGDMARGAGIGVGVTAAAALLALAAFLLLRRRRKPVQPAPTPYVREGKNAHTPYRHELPVPPSELVGSVRTPGEPAPAY